MSRFVPGKRRDHHKTFHLAGQVTSDHVGHLVSVGTTDRSSRGILCAVAADGDQVRLDLQLRDGRQAPVRVECTTPVLVHRTTQRKGNS
ncbi:hypothetical protein [Kocuria sp. CPCC 205297]|uniref:hypothetical protein n=1 Tax=Kocuria sp. CPCC 205297 TaxID=3073558 RepID=UPI0034D5E559